MMGLGIPLPTKALHIKSRYIYNLREAVRKNSAYVQSPSVSEAFPDCRVFLRISVSDGRLRA
jgi:hypothetical protein